MGLLDKQHGEAKKKIEELLAHYEDGNEIFKKAHDWNYPVTLKEEYKDQSDDFPQSWLELVTEVCGIIADVKYGLDTYKNTIEVISADQMLDLYVSHGIPTFYDHWSMGQSRAAQGESYQQGRSGLAYEIVINTDPAIAYCMENNSKTMMMLVIAHASFGHNHFFKNNHLFQQFTDASDALPFFDHMRKTIRKYEKKYGVEEVEAIVDACNTLMMHGVDQYKKPRRKTPAEVWERLAAFEAERQKSYDDVMERTVPKNKDSSVGPFNQSKDKKKSQFAGEENLLMFIADNAPHLPHWKREIIALFAGQSRYFYPQMQTKVMNEGCASFFHYSIMTDLYDMGFIDDGMYLEFITSHSGVLTQPDFDDPRYSGFNPYTLGFSILMDIKRICEEPTKEDKAWFPQIAGKGNWLKIIKDAISDYRDESFIEQYLSPHLIREFKMFSILDEEEASTYKVDAIHNRRGYERVRSALAEQYRFANQIPRIEVGDYDYKGDRSLTLHHYSVNNKLLDGDQIEEVLKHIYQLWKHPVHMGSFDDDNKLKNSFCCDPEREEAARRRRNRTRQYP